ncbi:MAG: hypothetical protein ACK5LC_03660 [Coprobacillaceae bacterium]
MEEKSSTFMTLGTALGMIIALVISFVLMFIIQDYTAFIPFIFIGFAMIFRIIGYGLDRFMDRKA